MDRESYTAIKSKRGNSQNRTILNIKEFDQEEDEQNNSKPPRLNLDSILIQKNITSDNLDQTQISLKNQRSSYAGVQNESELDTTRDKELMLDLNNLSLNCQSNILIRNQLRNCLTPHNPVEYELKSTQEFEVLKRSEEKPADKSH